MRTFEDLIRFAHGRGFDRADETMPWATSTATTDRYLPLSIVRARLMDRFTLEDIRCAPAARRATCASPRGWPAGLHHADDAQLLRKLQIACGDLLAHSTCASARTTPPLRAPHAPARRRASLGRHRRSHLAQAQRPMTSSSTGTPSSRPLPGT
jgi:hypothetical protein